MKKIVKNLRVKNDLGLHTRPATMIVKLLQNIKSTVFFNYKNETVDAKSILNILMLGVQKNGLITVIIEGIDALEAIDQLTQLFEERFGE